jgi:hypothetical protein
MDRRDKPGNDTGGCGMVNNHNRILQSDSRGRVPGISCPRGRRQLTGPAPYAAFASCSARHTRSGVIGMSMWVTPAAR